MSMITLIFFVLSVSASWEDIIINPPSGKTGQDAVLYYFQGASIKTDAYEAITKEIQRLVPFPLWVALPQCVGDACAVPTSITQGIGRVNKLLAAAGMPQDASVFFGGHSLGAAMIPDYVHNQAPHATGMLLHAGCLTRKYRTGKASDGRPQYEFPVPTLLLSGELDGLFRLTRATESYYNQLVLAADPRTSLHTMPVVTVKGMNHGQFANASVLPPLVKKNDLPADISDEDARYAAARDSASFMAALLGTSSWDALEQRVAETGTFLQPLIDAFNMEGYWQFLPPCLCENRDEFGGQQHGSCPSQPDCIGGSPWTSQYAQPMMAGGQKGLTTIATDSFHDVTEVVPSVHLPFIHGGGNDRGPGDNPGNGNSPALCATAAGCSLNVTTITQNMYTSQTLDTGLDPIGATELRAKLKSRQAVWQAAGVGQDVNLTLTDTPIIAGGVADRCGEINQAALDWAHKHANPNTVSRYDKKGKTLVIGPDQTTCAAGPCWINAKLKYIDQGSTVSVQSTVMVTANKNSIPCGEGGASVPCSAGFHYCKLLSPARAMEWIYVDSLKP